MRHEIKKIAKIANELTTFCMLYQAKDVKIQIKREEGKTRILVKAYELEKREEAIAKLEGCLGSPRETEFEEYYWELAGESEHSEELYLVGTMVDEGNIRYDEEVVCMELIRYNK
jgi:hypothetical protein